MGEWVDEKTYDGFDCNLCLIGQATTHLTGDGWATQVISPVANHFHLPYELIDRIFQNAVNCETKFDAMEMARNVLELE